MRLILAVAAGGALGSVLRYLLGKLVAGVAGTAFPYGTLAVNAIGCFAAGMLYVLLVERSAAPEWRALIMVGVLGGFTTFSAFAVETVKVWEQSGAPVAATNVFLSVVLSLGGCIAGFALARHWL